MTTDRDLLPIAIEIHWKKCRQTAVGQSARNVNSMIVNAAVSITVEIPEAPPWLANQPIRDWLTTEIITVEIMKCIARPPCGRMALLSSNCRCLHQKQQENRQIA